ncbi:MAG TPA: hypothetical protein VLE97_05125 [Gaiellaceae bacterium]|nr:hypothetical protein [Gaiellaceae bacterium]
MGFRALVVALAVAAVLGFSSNALASGGNYTVDGGTPFERLQVESALGASGFDWSMVQTLVTIHVARGVGGSHSLPGQIWLDSTVLDTGAFSWGVVQMEYAQQVQFALVTPEMRGPLTTLLGAQQWCYEDMSLARGARTGRSGSASRFRAPALCGSRAHASSPPRLWSARAVLRACGFGRRRCSHQTPHAQRG